MIPPGVDPSRLLALLDLSWWLTRAWHIALKDELGERREEEATAIDHERAGDHMIAIMTGWIVELLSPPLPACIAAALDSIGPTWRHEKTANLPEEARYKAKRRRRPIAYQRARNTVLDVIEAHGIPIFAAEGWEADDCIAAAAMRARALGLSVALVSSDKDHAVLVGPGVVQWAWGGGATGRLDVRSEAWVRAHHGVPPDQIPDLLAIMGDATDNVQGAEGLGDKGALAVLETVSNPLIACVTPHLTPLERALGLVVQAPDEAAMTAARRVRDQVRKAKPNALAGDEAAARHAQQVAAAEAALVQIKAQRCLARNFERLHAAAAQVRLARELVTLDKAAPIRWRPAELPAGGFDVPRLRAIYEGLGFTALARNVGPLAKKPIDEILAS